MKTIRGGIWLKNIENANRLMIESSFSIFIPFCKFFLVIVDNRNYFTLIRKIAGYDILPNFSKLNI